MLDLLFSLEHFSHKELWKGNFPWSPLLYLEEYLKHQIFQIEIPIPEHVFLENKTQISIGIGTTIEPGVYIKGPCIIGSHCQISHGAYIRENTLIGDHCHIGHSAEIKHSILLPRAAASHFCYVGDSILGNGVNLGAGVKCANLRLDRKEISITFENQKIPTGLKKFGALIGDFAQIGCNCVLNPGTLVGKESISFPLTNLKGFIPPLSKITPQGIEILEKLLWQSKVTARS